MCRLFRRWSRHFRRGAVSNGRGRFGELDFHVEYAMKHSCLVFLAATLCTTPSMMGLNRSIADSREVDLTHRASLSTSFTLLGRGERSGSVIRHAEAFMRDYAPKVAGTLEPYGGRFLTSAKVTALEGDVPQRFVIIAFDNAEKARAWYDSSAYQQLVPIRQKTATLFIAEGRPK